MPLDKFFTGFLDGPFLLYYTCVIPVESWGSIDEQRHGLYVNMAVSNCKCAGEAMLWL